MKKLIKRIIKWFKPDPLPERGFGCLKENKDSETYKNYKTSSAFFDKDRVLSVLNKKNINHSELKKYTPNLVLNQYEVNSSPAYAACNALFMMYKQKLNSIDNEVENSDELKLKYSIALLSPTWLYYQSRLIDKSPLCKDSGTRLSSVLEVLKQEGAITSNYMPFSYCVNSEPPCKTKLAKRFKIKDFYKVELGISNILGEIYLKQRPVLIGIHLYKDQLNYANKHKGILPIPNEYKDTHLGAQAMCIIGFKVKRNKVYLIALNSWGDYKAGDEGYYYIPEDILKSAYVDSLWVFDI